MLELVDSHCHIHAAGAHLDERDHITKKWHEAGETDPDMMIADAQAAGVTRLICVGTDIEDSRNAVNFVRDRPSCWASVGVHPHEAQAFLTANGSIQLNEMLKNPVDDKIVAIGECGLDYFL